METSPAPELPPAPPDLWPSVPPATATLAHGQLLSLHVPIFAERPLLTALARSVHLEMTCAGEWAARGGDRQTPQSKRQQDARGLARHFAQEAARLLSLYTAAYESARQTSEFQLRPDTLKEHATQTYRRALRNVREGQRLSAPAYNDTLFAAVGNGAVRPSPKPSRRKP